LIPKISESAQGLVAAEFGVTQVSALLFLVAAVVSLAFWFARKETIGKLGWAISLISTIALTVSIALRYINVGHIPYVQLYETFLFTAWCVAVVAVIADQVAGNRLPTTVANILNGLTLLYIVQWPEMSREGTALVPALQSPWLDVHIATCFLSYAGLAISASASVIYLVNRNEKVDELSYRLVTFAFPLLGLGILLGAVWANEAWGRYWGWDPKETAALVTWLVYAGYLHARLVLGWKGVRASWLNLIGFACVLFTWLGLNLLTGVIESLHAYT
jgi:ABC-type transport system involved in cytochrome c biogenesis permease subunit